MFRRLILIIVFLFLVSISFVSADIHYICSSGDDAAGSCTLGECAPRCFGDIAFCSSPFTTELSTVECACSDQYFNQYFSTYDDRRFLGCSNDVEIGATAIAGSCSDSYSCYVCDPQYHVEGSGPSVQCVVNADSCTESSDNIYGYADLEWYETYDYCKIDEPTNIYKVTCSSNEPTFLVETCPVGEYCSTAYSDPVAQCVSATDPGDRPDVKVEHVDGRQSEVVINVSEDSFAYVFSELGFKAEYSDGSSEFVSLCTFPSGESYASCQDNYDFGSGEAMVVTPYAVDDPTGVIWWGAPASFTGCDSGEVWNGGVCQTLCSAEVEDDSFRVSSSGQVKAAIDRGGKVLVRGTIQEGRSYANILGNNNGDDRFVIKSGSGNAVASFDRDGELRLFGLKNLGETQQYMNDNFLDAKGFKIMSGGNVKAYIDGTGNLYTTSCAHENWVPEWEQQDEQEGQK